ncbi:hypothetical protein TNCV_2883531 [Trichonephila clavipes]|nr:hypothetical protein TNCV_2883531 [Trichonephila clavipes]
MNPHLPISVMVSLAVQGQVPHPLIVPEFLLSTSCRMTSARCHEAIVYRLNSGSGDRQTGRHNSKEGEGGRRRDQEERRTRKSGRENGAEKRTRESGRENGRKEKGESGRERAKPALNGEKGLSPEIGVKKTMNAGGVENGNMN